MKDYYLAVLAAIRESLDNPLKIAKQQYTEKGKVPWIGPLVKITLTNFQKPQDDQVGKWADAASNFILNWGAIIVGTGLATWINLSAVNWKSPLLFLIPVLFLGNAFRVNVKRMSTIGDPLFNLGAYKALRPREYAMILPYIKESAFSFAELYGWLSRQREDTPKIIEMYEQANAELKRTLEEYEAHLEAQKSQLDRSDSELDKAYDAIEQLVRQVKINEDGYNYAIDILFRLRRNVPSLFKRDDLRIISSYSLYHLRGDVLHMIDQLGTTETPATVRLDDPRYEHYTSVKLIKNNDLLVFGASDRTRRNIASYRIIMEDGEVFVYNFHFDSREEQLYDIIESKEMFRLVRIICIHLYERGMLAKEGEPYENT